MKPRNECKILYEIILKTLSIHISYEDLCRYLYANEYLRKILFFKCLHPILLNDTLDDYIIDRRKGLRYDQDKKQWRDIESGEYFQNRSYLKN